MQSGRVSFHTLGCKLNFSETSTLAREFERGGFVRVAPSAEADICVINSCSVTEHADKKCRNLIRRLHRRNPQAIIAVTGCYAQLRPQEIAAIEGVDIVLGNNDKCDLFKRVAELSGKGRARIYSCDTEQLTSFFAAFSSGDRTRAFLKVQDGCCNFCTYCIIPYARGAVRSLPADQAAEQAKGLARQGYRELVITGIELSTYGRDLPGRPDLASLIEAVCHAVPEMRVRLGSLEPRTVTEDFCARLAALPNLCPHFHLSLQSGSDTVLARMKRKYTTQRFLESVRLLRAHFDRPALTTDLIVGFPGETEEEFQETLAFLQRCAFAQMHIFPYSRRQGTPAASMPGQLSNAEKANRAHRGAELAQAMERSWLTGWIGQTVPVLFEEEKDGFWRGHTPQYIEVRVKGEHLHNQLRPVTITAAGDSLAYGTVKEEQP